MLRNIHGRKTLLACLREGNVLDISESLRDIPLSTQLLAPFFFLFSTDIPRNILRLARALMHKVKHVFLDRRICGRVSKVFVRRATCGEMNICGATFDYNTGRWPYSIHFMNQPTWAGQNLIKGPIWPAGRTLDTPDLCGAEPLW